MQNSSDVVQGAYIWYYSMFFHMLLYQFYEQSSVAWLFSIFFFPAFYFSFPIPTTKINAKSKTAALYITVPDGSFLF